MAAYEVSTSKHETLTGATVDTLTFDQHWTYFRVFNFDPTEDIYISLNDVAPTVAGDDTLVVPAGSTRRFLTQTKQIKLIGDGNAYSVEGENDR